MQKKYQIKSEKTVNFNLLSAYLIKHIPLLLLFGIVVCLLLCAKSFAGGSIGADNSGDFNDKMTEYQSQKEMYENKIAADTRSLQEMEDYVANSVLVTIDPMKETKSEFNIYVNADKTKAPQIVHMYKTALENTVDYSQVADELQLTPDCVKELVRINSDYDANVVNIAVIGNDSDTTEKIAHCIYEAAEDSKEDIALKYSGFTVVFDDITSHVTYDESLMLNEKNGAISTGYNLAEERANNRINVLKTNLAKNKEAYANLEVPSAGNHISKESLVKKGGLGFVLGILAGAFLLICKFIADNKVRSEKDMTEMGVKNLGVLPMSVKNKPFSKLSVQLSDSARNFDKEAVLKQIASNINDTAAGTNLAFVTVEDDKNLTDLVNELNLAKKYSVRIINNFKSDENAAALLKDSEVVLVTRRNVTRLDDIASLFDFINDWNISIVGSIVL